MAKKPKSQNDYDPPSDHCGRNAFLKNNKLLIPCSFRYFLAIALVKKCSITSLSSLEVKTIALYNILLLSGEFYLFFQLFTITYPNFLIYNCKRVKELKFGSDNILLVQRWKSVFAITYQTRF